MVSNSPLLSVQRKNESPFLALSSGTTPPGEAAGRLGLAVVAAILVVLFSWLNPAFFDIDNFVTIGVNSTSILIAVIGTSALLIAGYVDLSIGSMIALVGIVTAKIAVASQSAVLAATTGICLGTMLGLLNGLLVRRLSISPLIVTLAMLALYGGLAYVVSSTAVYGFPPNLLALGRGRILGIQYTVLIALAVFVTGGFLLTRTRTGLRLYAIGGDTRAAELCGVPVGRTIITLYAINGALIGLIAVLLAGRLGSIPPTIGQRFELDVLTAAILGGVAFSGGTGRPLGIAIGVATIGILNAGLIFVGLQSWWQNVAVGAMLLFALAADQIAMGIRSARKSGQLLGFADVSSHVPANNAPAKIVSLLAQPIAQTGCVFEINAAHKAYGPVVALENGSFSVGNGEIVCLLGDNGAGKSTLVKIISGAVRPDRGTMRFEGREVSFGSPQDARKAGLETVYQDLALCPNLSIVHNMILGREPMRRWLGVIPVRDDRRAAQLCSERLLALGVTLQDHNVLVRSLSGGQRQCIAIARSLGEHVKLICLDEPTAALGVKQTAQVVDLIRSIARSGTGVILVTHDMATVRALADRIVVLRLGCVVYDGLVQALSTDDLWSLMAGAGGNVLP